MHPVTRIGWQQKNSDKTEPPIDLEWLITNGLGGYASGTVAGTVTRRYHGLLIAALPNPFGRTMMFDHLAETIRLQNGKVFLFSHGEKVNDGPSDASHHLEQFRLEMGLPIWTYRFNEFSLEKRVVLAHLQNTVYIRYRLINNQNPIFSEADKIELSLQPAMHFRPHDDPVSRPIEPYTLCLTGNRFEASIPTSLPSLKIKVEGEGTIFEFYPEHQERINYRWEEARGYAAKGTLWSPGRFKAQLSIIAPITLVASTESWETLNAVASGEAWEYEIERRSRLLHAAPKALIDRTTAELVLAADQFLITPAGRADDATRARAQGEELRTVIAGYHWFTDWGRDTMISLEGLTLCTGRYSTAHFILHTFSRYVKDGLIPNLFPEGSREGLYHTADASLWFFHALDRYHAYTSDDVTIHQLLPILQSIVDTHIKGTRFGIMMDPRDGLLGQGEDGFALTWMDALCEGWVVTPRRGKAVEINALWFNALTLISKWLKLERDYHAAKHFEDLSRQVKDSFNRKFWNEKKGHLNDVISLDDKMHDDSLRPNQILSISLPNPVLNNTYWQQTIDIVSKALRTPLGLRSLDPQHVDFKANYHGDSRTRDAAYHQGTVWSWLIGPFIDAWLKVYPTKRKQARDFLQGLEAHLGESCLGSVSEIFDAIPPYHPRGCIAQAWGVAEFLRVWHLTFQDPKEMEIVRS